MSSRTFVIADTHFCHEAAVSFNGRAQQGWHDWEEMNKELVYRWNQVVRPQDIVWHLGDVALCGGDPEKLAALDSVLMAIHGELRLVLGNHDNYARLEPYFDWVYGAREIKNCILTHIPVHPGQKKRFRMNIHGHLHDERVQRATDKWVWEQDEFGLRAHEIVADDPWYVSVSAEQTDYAPVDLHNLIEEASK
jgi:calcineurin-like phosphoesterase family protein